ncbi:monoglyceride lipase-like [Saccoglossus kowalevskii]|uniref:Monoglyceride lipase-like n=1 Tax=Saccoglossus kowalevskii TaxID=10224 RepID=A0ABM0GYM4_SACKO|nr:PREDICTED: monoglyceride lipase-like [Saccoglossus kowalevskii]
MATSPQGVPYEQLAHYVNADGQCIFTRCWAPPTDIEIRALCLVLHGAAEHSGPYDRLAIPLTGCGVMVYAHDHVGHGQSQGDQMDITDFNIYIRDTLQHVDVITSKHPNLPIFLFGHSLGGAIAILTAMERPEQFTGVVMTGPAITVHKKLTSSLTMNLLRFTSYWFPKHELDKINPEHVSRDPKEVELYRTDPLVWHGGLKARFVAKATAAFQQIQNNMSSIEWPFLILHGDADNLCDINGSKMLVERAKSTDKHLQVYPGHYHALICEPPKDAAVVIRDITSWIVRRIPENATKPDDVHYRD